MQGEPSVKRAVAFFDGQNLFHAVKNSFRYSYPNFDPSALASSLCASQSGWRLEETRFYTGVPDVKDDPFWNHFWDGKRDVRRF